MSFYIRVCGRSSFPIKYWLFSGVGTDELAFSGRIVGRPWAGEDRTVDGVDWMWWSWRGCRRQRRIFHWSVADRRYNIRPWYFFARMTRVVAYCRRWQSPTRRGRRMPVLRWLWLWIWVKCILCPIRVIVGSSERTSTARMTQFVPLHVPSLRSCRRE